MCDSSAPLDHMIQEQLVRRGIRDPRVLAAMSDVDRIRFVPEQWRRDAYRDGPLPLVCEQTISQPYIVGLMSQLLKADASSRCLEIGSGSGYQTAILCHLCGHVTSIEVIPELHRMADRNLAEYRFTNLKLIQGDGRKGYPQAAPFDRIMVTAAPESLPSVLFDQLAEGGIMVIPIGDRSGQVLYQCRKENGNVTQEAVCGVLFVPLT